MQTIHKKSIIMGASAAVIILTFAGLIIATMPIHTSETELVNRFVLDAPFKEVRKTLQKADLAKAALEMSGGQIVSEEVVYRKVGFEGALRNWNFRQIVHTTVSAEGTTLFVQSDTQAVPESVDVLVTLRKPNTKIGLRQLRQSIRIVPLGELQTIVTHESLVSVTRKCPTLWHNYMDTKVREAVESDIQSIEYLMRQYVERR